MFGTIICPRFANNWVIFQKQTVHGNKQIFSRLNLIFQQMSTNIRKKVRIRCALIQHLLVVDTSAAIQMYYVHRTYFRKYIFYWITQFSTIRRFLAFCLHRSIKLQTTLRTYFHIKYVFFFGVSYPKLRRTPMKIPSSKKTVKK